jgi:hypothetical protein
MDEEAHNRPHDGAADDPFGSELPRLLREVEPPPVADLDALFADVQRSVAAERGARAWLRGLATPVRALLAAAVIALLAVLAVTVFGRPDMAVYPIARMALLLVVIAGGLSLLVALALRPLQRPAVPGWLATAITSAALIALLAVYGLPAAHVDHPASVQAPGWLPLLRRAWPCLLIGSTLAAFVYAFLSLLDRGGGARTVVTAAASGLAANLALQLHCPVTDPMHMVFGHLGVVLLVTTVGLLARRTRG